MQRLTSLNFNMEEPSNVEAYRQYERKMEISEELTTRKKDLQKAKELVLTVSRWLSMMMVDDDGQ